MAAGYLMSGVSQANACPYCVSVPAMMLHGAGEPAVAETRLTGETSDITGPGPRQLARWASRILAPDDPLVRERPFPAAQQAEIIGTAVAFHYLNPARRVGSWLAPARSAGCDARAGLEGGYG